MKSFFNIAAAAALFVVTTSVSMASGDGFLVPEPGSIGLAVIGIAAAAYFLSKGKRK